MENVVEDRIIGLLDRGKPRPRRAPSDWSPEYAGSTDHCERLNLLEEVMLELLVERTRLGEDPFAVRESLLGFIDRGRPVFSAIYSEKVADRYVDYMRAVLMGSGTGELQRLYLDFMAETNVAVAANAKRVAALPTDAMEAAT